MAGLSPFANVRGDPYQGQNVLATTPQFQTAGGGVQMDPRILDIIKNAAMTFPLKVEAFSGVEGRASGTQNHPLGYAIDVRIYDDKGRPLANSPQDAQRLGQSLGESFRTYEAFAQTARDIQTRKYPELNDVFRFGGYFNAGDTPFDVMHFDVNPAMNGVMGGGTWDTGLSKVSQKMLPGAESIGMTDVALKQMHDLGFTGPNAVQAYQQAKGLTVDGVVGPQTTGRLALDVTPPGRIPNPYGLKDTADAIAGGDPEAVKAALTKTLGQVTSAHLGGTPPQQIEQDFHSYLSMLSPAEQAHLTANFDADPEMRASIDPKMLVAVDQAFQASRDLAQSLQTGRPVGATTPQEIADATRRMTSVNPGRTTNAEGMADLPRIRPASSLAAEAVPPRPQEPSPVAPASGAFAGLTPRIRPQSDALGTAAGAENFSPRPRPAPDSLGIGRIDPRPRMAPADGPFAMNPPDVLGTPNGAENPFPRLRPQSDALGTAAGAENFMPRLRQDAQPTGLDGQPSDEQMAAVLELLRRRFAQQQEGAPAANYTPPTPRLRPPSPFLGV